MKPGVPIILYTTALLLLSKATVQKILCDQLSVNMAARPMFGTRDLSYASSREYDYSERRLQKQERKQIAKLILSEIWIQ